MVGQTDQSRTTFEFKVEEQKRGTSHNHLQLWLNELRYHQRTQSINLNNNQRSNNGDTEDSSKHLGHSQP